jgi:phosphoglycolate phosphatase-like HAD superfamily hydrolase
MPRLAQCQRNHSASRERTLAEGGLASQFEVIIGGEDVVQHKPHPDGLLLALQRLHLPVTDVLYVGDHPVDAEAASRVGVPFMAVLTGTSDVPSFAPTPYTAFSRMSRTCPASFRCSDSITAPAPGAPGWLRVSQEV